MKTSEPSPQTDLLPMELEKLTLSVAASPARMSAMQELVQGWKALGQACGLRSLDWFAIYDRAMSLWRTSRLSLAEDLDVLSETWPRSGMTRNGIAFRLPTLAQNITGIESGLLPTLCARDFRWGARPERTKAMRQTSKRGLDLPSELRLRDWNVAVSPDGAETFMGFPPGWTELKPSEMPSSRKSRK